MKLKGLVWFFTIVLIVVSLWELSYTWAVKSHENKVKAQAEKIIKKANPELKGTDFDNAVKLRVKRLLDSNEDKKIYLGSSYKKCKENELNLGLDLQGGMSATMDVALDGMLTSLSNDPKNLALSSAIKTANTQRINSDENYISLFRKAFAAQNGSNKLASLFAGPNKEVKLTDNDDQVEAKLNEIGKGAIKETYRILTKRIDKFGVAQPSINLDENKGIITVELAGVDDEERVKNYLTTSANLQFWETYNLKDIGTVFQDVDKQLSAYLNGIDTINKIDSSKLRPFSDITNPNAGYILDDKQRPVGYAPNVGIVAKNDEARFEEFLELEVVKNIIPANIKFMLGKENKGKNGQSYKELYALKADPLNPNKAQLEGDAIETARQQFDDKGQPSVGIDMKPNGSRIWAKMTGNAFQDDKKAIAISLDNIVYTAPRVNNGAITGGKTEISGGFNGDNGIQEAQDLARVLQSGRLNAPAKIVASQVVGPTLGKEAVKGGSWSFLISFLVIFVLMLVYYNTAGWIANIALILNLLFTVGILSAWGATLTAAGIAGLVLTIGMAVDTNVIIFERIKEELTKGKSYQQAVNDGYKRSLAPVLDAHVTTFLTAAILFYFGLGPVLGFATTQMLGIVLSLFCGILLSRLITETWMNKNRHFNYFTSISKRVFKHAAYKFIEYRKYAYMISIVVLLAGIGALINGFDQGVEFKGGRSFDVRFDNEVNADAVRTSLKTTFGDYPIVKTVGDKKHLNIVTSYLKGVDKADSLVQTKLFEGLKNVLPNGITYSDFIKNKYIEGKTEVQPSISEDLKRGAVKATIFAMLIIFIYIFIRFRDWRYSAGTIVALLHDVLVTLAVFSFFRKIVPFPLEIDQHFIAAVLTVIGFSMNDTVIVFDRVREYARTMRGADKSTIINKAINDTLSRTIMTSLTVFLTILILFIFGGEVTRGFAFAMLIGVITGTYSSIFVAAPILVDLAKDKPLGEPEPVKVEKKKA